MRAEQFPVGKRQDISRERLAPPELPAGRPGPEASAESAKKLSTEEIEARFMAIFRDKASRINSISGQPDLKDPGVKFIYIQSALLELCREPGFPPESAAAINRALVFLDMQAGISRADAGDADLTKFHSVNNRAALANFINALRPVFSEKAIAAIEQQL
jgi:hypothetical protein